MTTYKTNYFKIKELVCPELIERIPENILWEMFDTNLLVFADFVRETFGITTCNDLVLTDCGARSMESGNKYPEYDPHKYFRALDLHIVSIDENHVGPSRVAAYNELRTNLIQAYSMTSGVNNIHFENDVSWLHIDTYNRPNQTFSKEK
jgi:hypothetical protein